MDIFASSCDDAHRIRPGIRPGQEGGYTVKINLTGRAGWIPFGIMLVALFVVAWIVDDRLDGADSTSQVSGAQASWLIGVVLVGIGVLIAGQAVNGRWSGALIDSRNRYSLAQTQAVIWLMVISSALIAAAVSNVHRGVADPLDLAIPAELLAIIGLAVTSIVGTPLIRATKLTNTPDTTQAEREVAKLGKGETRVDGAQVFSFGAGDDTTPTVATEGSVVSYMDAESTGWADLLRGEETGNASKVDLGKLQLLYFTAVTVGVYSAAILAAFAAPEAGSTAALQLPALGAGIVGLLALSHAGALGYQAAPHAKEA